MRKGNRPFQKQFASRIPSPSYTGSPRVLRKIAATIKSTEEEDSDVDGRPQINMKAKKRRKQ